MKSNACVFLITEEIKTLISIAVDVNLRINFKVTHSDKEIQGLQIGKIFLYSSVLDEIIM